MKTFLGKCNGCKKVYRVTSEEAPLRVDPIFKDRSRTYKGQYIPLDHDGTWTIRCNCLGEDLPHTSKHIVRFGTVRVKITKAKCNAKCTHAYQLDCSCSCGGVNHGKGFAA